MEHQQYPGCSKDYKLELPDSLGLYGEEISLFLKGGHYDIIYKKEFATFELNEEEVDFSKEKTAQGQIKQEDIYNFEINKDYSLNKNN